MAAVRFRAARAVVDAAKQGSAISNIAFTAAHQQVIYGVSLAFYAKPPPKRVSPPHAIPEERARRPGGGGNRYKHEIGTVVEVAQTRQGTAQASWTGQAEGGAEDAYLALISAMGISPLTRLTITDISRRKLSASMTVPVKRIISAALARRPDVLTGYAAEQASLANLRAAQAKFFPKIFFAANGTRLSGSLNVTAIPGIGQQLPIVNLPTNQLGVSGTQLGATALIGATVPLYDGGSRAASLEQARDKVDKAETTLTQIRNEAVRQIVVAGNTLKTSLSAYSAATALASAAQTTFNAALVAYRNGVGPISDVTTAERQLLEAKNATTDAYSTALSAAATLGVVHGHAGRTASMMICRDGCATVLEPEATPIPAHLPRP